MVKEITYRPQGVCSRAYHIVASDGVIDSIDIVGGCDGNLKAISKLVEGMTVDEVAAALEGNTCGRRATSCADQLVRGLREARAKELADEAGVEAGAPHEAV